MTKEYREYAKSRIEYLLKISSFVFDERDKEALEAAIQALSQMSEIEENIIKYMKKYPNHVGNIDFWEGFYACRNVVLQLDDEEYAPKEQEPCDDAISREDVLAEITRFSTEEGASVECQQLYCDVNNMPSVTQKSGKWIIDRTVVEKTRQYLTYECGYRRIVNYHNDVHCSECGFKYAYTTDKEDSIPTNFCPNCGAKMESEVRQNDKS